jgi:cation diffusion facilitator family transporter
MTGAEPHHHHKHAAPHNQPAVSGWRGRLWHQISAVLGGHTHEAADQVDTALDSSRKGQRALLISLGILLATALVQSVVVALTGSVALLSDTLHNFADALTAVPLLIAFRLARRPATRRFTYGYGRAEDIAGLFVVFVIAVSAVLVGYQAVTHLFDPQVVNHVWAVAAAGLVGFAGNEAVARYRIGVGKEIGSAALVADGLHARSDGLTSLAVVASAAGVAAGWTWVDAAVGLVITVVILGVLRAAVLQVGARLMDAVDPALVDQATEAIARIPKISQVRTLRIRWIGHTLRAEVDVTVAAELTVEQAHEIAHHAEHHLLHDVPRLTGATVHVSPAGAHDA